MATFTANADPEDRRNHRSSLDNPADFPECRNDCISGRANRNTSNQAFVGGDPRVRIGRFGLRAAGPTMMQFVAGGLQGELSFTSVLNLSELTSHVNVGRPGCRDLVPEPEVALSTPLSLRALIHLTAADFAACIDGPVESLGCHTMKGVQEPQQIFAIEGCDS